MNVVLSLSSLTPENSHYPQLLVGPPLHTTMEDFGGGGHKRERERCGGRQGDVGRGEERERQAERGL